MFKRSSAVIAGALCLIAFSAMAQINASRATVVIPVWESLHNPQGLLLGVKSLQTLDAATLKKGDPVEFELLLELKRKDGTIAIPQGAKLKGVVTQAISRNSEQPESRLAVHIDRAEWQGGSVKLDAAIGGVMKLPTVQRYQNLDRQPETSELPDLKNMVNGVQYIPNHPWVQREVSPGETPVGYDTGVGMNDSPIKDGRLLAMEDVKLKRDPRTGTVLVSTRKNVRMEKWTYLLVETTTVN